jgi:hypothetical protein
MTARNPFASSIPDIYDPYAMIQSSRPVRLSTGYYIVRNLLLVGAVAGSLVALYRNDVFRELARRAGQESRYLAVESSLVGTPGWGTPRSMEPVLAETSAVSAPAAPTIEPPASPAGAVAERPAAVATTSPVPERTAATPAPASPARLTPEPVAAAVVTQQAPAAPPPALAAPSRPIDPLAPVSLESLPVLPKAGSMRQPVSFGDLPASGAAAPAAPIARAAAPTAPARSTPATRAAARAPEPEPAPVPVAKKPEPPKVKTTDAHKNDNPLMAAVRSAVRARPPKE